MLSGFFMHVIKGGYHEGRFEIKLGKGKIKD